MDKIKVGISSEIGVLDGVILHTPGHEVENMTPENAVDDLKLFAFDLCARNNEYPSQKDLKTIAKTTYDRLNKK